MSVSKKIFVFLFFFYLSCILLLANEGNDNQWPGMFSGDDVLIVVKDLDGNIQEYKARINDERMINSGITNDILWWLKKSFKAGFGEAKYNKEIANNLLDVIRQIAWNVQDKIDNCKFLQDMYGDQIKGKDKYPISFQYYSDNACGDTMGTSVRVNNILLHKILKDIGEQMKNGVEKIQVNVSKYTCGGQENNDIVTIMGHETLHAILGAGEPSTADECVVHCLTKKCLAENPDDYKIKDYVANQGGNLKCNEITDEQWDFVIDRTGDVDPREEMKAGDCFCDEEWTEDADCDENKPNQPPPQGGSSRTTRYAKVYLPDTPDDHYSYSDLIAFSDNDFSSNAGGSLFGDTFKEVLSFSYYPDILIYSTYGNSLMENLLTKIMPGNFIDDYDHDYFSKNQKAY